MKQVITALFISLNIITCFAQQRSWARTEFYADRNTAITKTPDVVFMGNSITEFWGRDLPEFFSDNNYACRGISGQTSEQMLVRFRQDVIDLHPQAVVISTGINDIAENNGKVTDEHIMNNIKSMCELAIANKITPILCSICPCDYFSWRPDLKPALRVIKLNKQIKKYALTQGLQYVDYHKAMSTSEGSMITKYTGDRCHPNIAGYEVMIPIVTNAIKKVIK